MEGGGRRFLCWIKMYVDATCMNCLVNKAYPIQIYDTHKYPYVIIYVTKRLAGIFFVNCLSLSVLSPVQ